MAPLAAETILEITEGDALDVSDACTFCQHLGGAGARRLSESLLMESERFVVWPSVGALVPGWVLIVPKTHRLALADLPPEDAKELGEVQAAIGTILHRQEDAVVRFEHGPAAPGEAAGCGVDHAHLHVVPTKLDLLAAAREARPDFEWRTVESVHDARDIATPGQSYLYLHDQASRRWVAAADRIPSQFFRQLIARAHGVSDQYDWKSFPWVSNVQATVRLFETLR